MFLTLLRVNEQVQGDMQQQMEQQQQLELTKQAGQFASAPMADPTKNPQLGEQLSAPGNEAPAQEAGPPQG